MGIIYRLFTGIIFSVAALIAMPTTEIVIRIINSSTPSIKELLKASEIGLYFVPFAFIWGYIFTTKFTRLIEKKIAKSIALSFLWGTVITFLTIFSLGLYLGVSSHLTDGTFVERGIMSGFGLVLFGFIGSMGIVFLVGGSAGVFTKLLYQRVHNTTLQRTSRRMRRYTKEEK